MVDDQNTTKKRTKGSVEDLLKEAREAFECVEEAEEENRRAALKDLNFGRLGEQWPEEIRRIRESESRPCLTSNRLPAYIRHVVNYGRQNRPQISVQAVDDIADPRTAKIMQGLIYSINQQSNGNAAFDIALDYSVSMGFGYVRIDVDYAYDDTFDLDILIKSVPNPFSVYGDPDCMDATSAEWNSAFILEDMSRKAFKERWPDAEPVSFSDYESGQKSGKSRKTDDKATVVVAEYWRRDKTMKPVVKLSDGTVMDAKIYESNRDSFDLAGLSVSGSREVRSYKVLHSILSGEDVLEDDVWVGKYIPIVPVYGEDINVEGKRYLRSLIRDPIDTQLMFNYWRMASAEMISLSPKAPFIGPVGAFTTDSDKWATANTKSHAYIEYDGPVSPERQGFAGPPAGILQEAANAAEDMKSIMGIYDGAMGARSNEVSGLAIRARARQADVGSYHFIDNLNRSIVHSGCIEIDLIPHVYSPGRVIRCLLGPGNDEPQKITLGQPQQMPDGAIHIYDLTYGKYDIVLVAGPSFSTRREEAAEQMMQLLTAYPQMGEIVGDLLVKNLDWPGANEIADRLKEAMAEAKGKSPAMQEHEQQIEQLKQTMQQQTQAGLAFIEELQAKITKLVQDRTLDARKADIAAYEAETKRLLGLSKDQNPEAMRMNLLQMIAQTLASPDILPVTGVPPPPPGVSPQLVPRETKPDRIHQPPLPVPGI